MGWDSSRPVPWQRLVREWLIYVAVMAVILFVAFRDSGFVGALAGLLASGPLYLLLGYVMAKFGYQRRTLSEMRSRRAESSGGRDPDAVDGTDAEGTSRPRRPPAPTKRTSGGGDRPRSRSRRR
ncbi:hypothetical protein [Ilumatobacter sp.]|uniref:hypothetical protein n=1 Tax=Ilumatobacter sp. TaxID=1967498 RepID=UPI003B51DA10